MICDTVTLRQQMLQMHIHHVVSTKEVASQNVQEKRAGGT